LLTADVLSVGGFSGNQQFKIIWECSDAEDFHSPENIEKMRCGIPLSEVGRIP
jgi:gluconate kinase